MKRKLFLNKIIATILFVWLSIGEAVGTYSVSAATFDSGTVSGNDLGINIVNTVSGNDLGENLANTVSGNGLGENLVNIVSENDLEENTETSVIKKGIPVLDGVVDDMYKSSLTLDVGVGENSYGTEWSDDHGKVYLLYSDHYLYICADIIDDSVVSAGEIYVSGSNPYNNDNCEFRLSLNGGTDTIKVGIDAYGIRAYGLAADEKKIDYSKILYKTTYNDSVDNSGYVIEAAIPCTEGILDMHTAGKLGFKIQLNDLDANGMMRAFATDYAGEGTKGLVYYDLSTEIVSGEGTDWNSDANLGGDGSGDVTEEPNYKKLSFETADSNYVVNNTTNNGNHAINKADGTADISYGNFYDDNANEMHKYVLTARFESTGDYDAEYKYLRVLYSADNPEGVESVNVDIRSTAAAWETPSIFSVKDTNGEFVLSSPCELTTTITEGRLATAKWVQLGFVTNQQGGFYRVKAFYFFKTEEEANAFTVGGVPEFKKLSFGTVDGNYVTNAGSNNGNHTINKADGTVDITYGNFGDENEIRKYVLSAKFENASDYDADYKYLRVLYSADNPEGVESVNMDIRTPTYAFETPSIDSVKDTNGEFVLSSAFELPTRITEDRLAQAKWVQLGFATNVEGGSYRVKAFYFFKSAEDANAFNVSMEAPETVSIKINGNDIENYKIVVPENGFGNETECVAVLQQKIKDLCGVELPVVSDSTEVTEYEILIGNTNRAESDA